MYSRVGSRRADGQQDMIFSNGTNVDEAVRERDTVPVCILGEQQVQAVTSLSRTTRWRMERRGEFPQRLQLSLGRVGWREDEIVRWIESRVKPGKSAIR